MKKLFLTLMIMLLGTSAFAFDVINVPVDIALQRLKNGNARFVDGAMKHPDISKSHRIKLLNGQHPFAVVVTCSDSRVVPEFIFDQGLGDIFVIRNAGNVIDEHVLGSIEYAVHHLGVNLVVVLGHESCGAVGAAMKEDKETPNIESIKESILPAVEKCKADKSYAYENVIKTNAKLSADEILQSEDIKKYYKTHDLKVIPAYYHLGTGEVDFLEPDSY